MDKTTIKKLRKKLDNESLSYDDIVDIESAFAEIPDEQLRDLRENAMASDMLDEIEQQNSSDELKTSYKCSYCKTPRTKELPTSDETGETYCPDCNTTQDNEDNCLHNYNDDICTTCGDVRENETDKIIKRREELMDLFTPNGNNWDELMELLELERQLTLEEE